MDKALIQSHYAMNDLHKMYIGEIPGVMVKDCKEGDGIQAAFVGCPPHDRGSSTADQNR